MILIFGRDSKFLIVIGKLIDADFAVANTLNNLFFDLFNIGFLSSFNLNLMRGDNFHFVLIYSFIFLFLFIIRIIVATGVIFAFVMTHIVWIALGASLTNCEINWFYFFLLGLFELRCSSLFWGWLALYFFGFYFDI